MAKKKETTDESIKQLEARFGKGTIIKASDKKLEDVKEWTSTGSITLDLATGGKGVPKGGKTTCILGKESSSKTTLALHVITEEQKKGGLCAFLDVEGTLDLEYAEALGVNLELLHLIDQEEHLKSIGVKDRKNMAGEEWLELLAKMLQSNLYEIIVLDSVAALIPMAEIQNGLSGGAISRLAAMMSKGYRTINAALSVSKTGFVYLNQYRMNPGGYGNPFIEPAGEAWKYLQALKIEISKSLDKDTDGVYGIHVKGKITKSKVCTPYKEFQYYVEFGKGIQRTQEIFDLASQVGLITKAGAWYSLPELEDKLQGEDKVLEFLNDNPEYKQKLEERAVSVFIGNEVIETIKEQ